MKIKTSSQLHKIAKKIASKRDVNLFFQVEFDFEDQRLYLLGEVMNCVRDDTLRNLSNEILISELEKRLNNIKVND